MSDDDQSGKARDREFPVDTLGIPILVDVVESSAPPNRFEPTTDDTPHAEDDADKLTLLGDFAAADTGTEARDAPSGRPTPEQLIDEISAALSDELVKKIKPLIRKRVRRALRAYEASRSRQQEKYDAD